MAPEDGLEIDELLNHADLALYGAKAEGRGSYRYYEPEMNARMKWRRSLEVDLRAALLKNEFVLYYQPILALGTGIIAGCEALLRWRHPQRGMVLPAEFVPVAEETGLINSIGEWVLKQACSDATAWPSSVRVAVNVSPAQFRNSALPLVVVGALAESGLPTQRLELEITESVLMQNNESSLLMLHSFTNSACASRWTISAPAIRRFPISEAFHSTASRSTVRLSLTCWTATRPWPSCTPF